MATKATLITVINYESILYKLHKCGASKIDCLKATLMINATQVNVHENEIEIFIVGVDFLLNLNFNYEL